MNGQRTAHHRARALLHQYDAAIDTIAAMSLLDLDAPTLAAAVLRRDTARQAVTLELLRDLVDEYTVVILELTALIQALTDPAPCRYDHNGYCQTHYHDRPCPHGEASAYLRAGQ